MAGKRDGSERSPSGLVRGRLVARLADPAAYRIAWITAPAGSGKSRLLSHLSGTYAGPVVACGSPLPSARDRAGFASWLAASLGTEPRPIGPRPAGGDPVDVLEAAGSSQRPRLLVMDDVHLLEGSAAEDALTELVEHLPADWRLVAATRVALRIDLSRLRVSGELLELGADDLRFRTWEIEELFRHVYRQPLLPEDVAALARRTDGWAAYLQLFHLATSRRPQSERRVVLDSLDNRARLVREYLGRHVLAALEPGLRDFLVRTSVLRQPSGALCDELMGVTGSHDKLEELERRQVFTERVDDTWFRYHPVLLSYLDGELSAAIGAEAAQAQHARAGRLLERDGWADEAMAAFALAEEWGEVGRLAGAPESVSGVSAAVAIEALAPGLLETDARLMAAKARVAADRGRFAEAVQILRRAEQLAASEAVADRFAEQRDRILAWTEPAHRLPSDWTGLVRRATQHQPLALVAPAAAMPAPGPRLAAACGAFLGGALRDAARLGRSVAAQHEATRAMRGAAAVLAHTSRQFLDGPAAADDTYVMLEEVEAARMPWLTRLAAAVVSASEADSPERFDDAADECRRDADPWGEALVTWLSGLWALRSGHSSAAARLARAARLFQALGAPVVEARCLAHAALACALGGQGEIGRRLARQARALAANHQVPAAAAEAGAAFGLIAGHQDEIDDAVSALAAMGASPWWERTAPAAGSAPSGHQPVMAEPASVAEPGTGDSGKGEPAVTEPVAAGPATADAGGPAPMTLRVLGGFELLMAGRRLDDSAAKPMERLLLHLLAARAGQEIHRDELIGALWPDAGAEAGRHRLQVAVSALRRLMASAAPDGGSLLARSGDCYVLAVPDGASVDILDLRAAARESSAARAGSDRSGEDRALSRLLAAYQGPLLPGDGAADWVVTLRREIEVVVADGAARLAALRLQADDAAGATEAARAGLAVDRYRDDVWKLLIDAAELGGNHAGAEKFRRDYEAVLAELGV